MLVTDFPLEKIVNLMLNPHRKIQVFCPNLNSTFNTVKSFCLNRLSYCNGIFDVSKPVQFEMLERNFSTEARKALIEYRLSSVSNMVSAIETESPEIYYPEDVFQIAMYIPSFDLNEETKLVKYQMTEDTLATYRCSRFSEDRSVPRHLIQLEQALNAISIGCYCVTVLPDNWQITDMRYNRWLENNSSIVARIELPEGCMEYKKVKDVKYRIQDQYGSWVDSGYNKSGYSVKTENKWHLVIFFKPYTVMYNTDSFKCPHSSRYYNSIDWSEYTYTPFKHKLESFSDEDLGFLQNTFIDSEWYKMSVYQWQKSMESMEKTTTSYGTLANYPRNLPSQENMFLVKASERVEQKIYVIDDLKKLKRSNLFVQIQPTRSKVKVIGHTTETKCLVAELMNSMGYEDDLSVMSTFLNQDFETVRHKLISQIYMHGMVPCMLSRDSSSIETRTKWLNRQLTPIERYVSVRRKDKSKSRSRFDFASKDEWDVLYDGIGIRSVYNEQYAQWLQRAQKIKLDKMKLDGKTVTFKFQLDDIIIRCMKDGNVNSSVMGLGKTRELLFAAILRGVKKILIVCPKKLIGTWQDEIEDTIIPFVRRVRRNWNGKLFEIGMPNVIEYAKDCLEENLTMFNIISFDKLKSTPKDGIFFKCPKCGFVTYSISQEKMRCPGDPFYFDQDPMQDTSCVGQLRRWKMANSERDEDGKLIHQKFKQWKVNGLKVHWNENHPSRVVDIGIGTTTRKYKIPDSECEIVDTRHKNKYKDPISGGPPRLPKMKKQNRMFDKTKKITVGHKKEISEDGTIVDVPIVRQIVRKCKGKKFHAKWTYAEVLRWRFPLIGVDEIMYVKNENSQRAMALSHVTAVIRYSDTGTPMKGLPQGIRNYINWTIDRDVFPWYRQYDPGGLKRFLTKYKTDVFVAGVETPDGKITGGKRKQIHKIKNADLFMSEMSPLMIRRVRDEPEVIIDIPDITCVYQDIKLDMDEQHKAFYRQWIEMFIEWWEAMKEEEEGKKVGPNILAKLSYLRNAATNPHFMLERLREKSRNIHKGNKGDEVIARWLKVIKPYKGPITAKMLKVIEIIQDAKLKGDKTIIGCSRSGALDFGQAICTKKDISSIVVDGRVSLDTKRGQSRSERHLAVQNFRYLGIDAMWCGIKALAEGMNIPEANHVVHHDVTWEPADSLQFAGRVIRPSQSKTVFSYFLMHKGTIEEYMIALCYLKSRSHSEGIDGVQFDDLSANMIPDIRQYAESIVDGTENVLKRKMWLKVEEIKKDWEEKGKQKLHSDDVNEDDFEDDDEENGG